MAANDIELTFICVDSSEHSTRALEWYLETIHKKSMNIALVHVHKLPDVPSFGLYSGGLVASDLYVQQVEESVKESRAVVKKYENILAEKGIKDVIILHKPMNDSIGHTIVTLAEEHKPSLIVIGQRGLGAIRRTLFGSVSDYVLHHTGGIPVCVVPPKE